MKTQWENFLQNLGEWHGSFAKLSGEGEILEDTPSQLLLEAFDNNQQARLTLRRQPISTPENPNPPAQELVREYQSFGRDILFFETGAFCQGTIQIAPFSESGAEFGFIYQNRRLRLVELFDKAGDPSSLILVREKRAGTDAATEKPLTLDALLGEWQGEAITIYPDFRSQDIYPTRLKLHQESDHQLIQELTFGSEPQTKTLTSTAQIQGSILHFDQSSPAIKVLLLPGGASATIPTKVLLKKPIFFEAGWLINPQLRQRLIRTYNAQGEWVSLTLVTEHKI